MIAQGNSAGLVHSWPAYSREAGNDPNGIAVVVPVFNGKSFIAQALRSIQLQAFPPAEIIVIDDCSHDGTADVVRKVGETDSRVQLLRNEFNRGPSYSRNRGLSAARSPIVAFLDADDQWLPEHLQNIRAAFQEFPEAAIAFTGTCQPDSLVNFNERFPPPRLMEAPVLNLLVDNPIPQSASAVRRKRVQEMGGYQEQRRFAEDYDLWMRLALEGAMFVEVPRATVLRNSHDNQVSVRHAPQMYQAAWNVRRSAIEAQYGSVADAKPDAIESLLQSEALSISAALHRRRRDLLELTVSATHWIPAPPHRLASVRQLLRWKWPFWRALAFAYDKLPNSVRRWLRIRRRQRRQ